MDKVKNILLTGATGFVGGHLLKGLLNSGYRVYALIRKTSVLSRIKNSNVEFWYVEEDIKKLFQTAKIDGVIHTATAYGQKETIAQLLETNLVLPLKLIEAGIENGIKFFINTDSFFTKSAGEYNYLNHYTKSKQLAINFLKSYADKLSIVNCKLEHVYGEYDGKAKFVTQILRSLIENKEEINLTEGLQKRDFIYVEDVVTAYLAILNHIDIYNGFNEIEIGTGNAVSIKKFVLAAKMLTNSTSKLNFGILPTRPGEFKESQANLGLMNQLGWQPAYTLEEGLQKTIENEK